MRPSPPQLMIARLPWPLALAALAALAVTMADAVADEGVSRRMGDAGGQPSSLSVIPSVRLIDHGAPGSGGIRAVVSNPEASRRPEYPAEEGVGTEFGPAGDDPGDASVSGASAAALADAPAITLEPLTGFRPDDDLLEFCDSYPFGADGGSAIGERFSGSEAGRWERLYDAFAAALCECDECYRPEWRLLESGSFWIESARPQSRARIRWDYGPGLILPDRAEYFWARVGGRGPAAPAGRLTVDRVDYHELSQMTETAHGGFSAFVVTPYRSQRMRGVGHSAGFGDIQIGTKSLLHDTPLMQVALQMTTIVPAGNSRKGLGVGHVSLEPALLFGLALTERDFLQGQAAQWIPLGGDADYQGALLRWGLAWNRLAWQRDRDNAMTVNLDLAGWSFQDGAYTDPVLGQRSASGETYLYLGPGTRLLMCGKYEFGIGSLVALTNRHFARSILRSEIILRY